MANMIKLKNPIAGTDFYTNGDEPSDYFWDILCRDGSIRIDARPMWISIPILRRTLASVPPGVWMYSDVAITFAGERTEAVQAALELLLLGETSISDPSTLDDINGILRAFGAKNAALIEDGRPVLVEVDSPTSLSPVSSHSPVTLDPGGPRPDSASNLPVTAAAKNPIIQPGLFTPEVPSRTSSPPGAGAQSLDLVQEAQILRQLRSSSIDEDKVVCGICERHFPLGSFEAGQGGVAQQFRRGHFEACATLARHHLNSSSEDTSEYETEADEDDDDEDDEEEEEEEIDDDEEEEEVVSLRMEMQTEDELPQIVEDIRQAHQTRTAGLTRKTYEVPDLGSLRAALRTVGGAKFMDKGNRIQCGLCQKVLSCAGARRSLFGKIQYFRKKHYFPFHFPEKIPVKPPQDPIQAQEEINQTLTLARLFQCRVCEKECKSGLEVKSHYKSDHCDTLGGTSPFQCHVCHERFDEIDSAVDHYRVKHRVQELFKCRLCGILFPKKRTFLKHMRSLHPEAILYQCPRCPSVFRTFTKLKHHLDGHKAKTRELTPEQVATKTCDICAKTFFNKENLIRHVARLHPEVARLKYKLLNCQVCEQLFLSPSTLAEHMKKHEKHKAVFECKSCEKRYTCKESLVSHMRRKHQLLSSGSRTATAPP